MANLRQLIDVRHLPGPAKLVVATILLIGAIGGIVVGMLLSRPDAKEEKLRRIDEYTGLGERTGLTGDLALTVDPVSLKVVPGRPIRVRLTLENRTFRTLVLNGWLSPAPADLNISQLPFKVRVTAGGRPVPFLGSPVLYPPHEKKDFFKLRPGERKTISVDLAGYPGIGRWDLSAPGDYIFEVWHETYLTGRYIGVQAWTGSTNHVLVQATILRKPHLPLGED